MIKNGEKYIIKNYTTANCFIDTEVVEIGDYTYGGINVLNYSKGSKLIIGCWCSIAPEVTFILNA